MTVSYTHLDVYKRQISGFYFAFPQAFNALFGFVDPSDRFTDQTLNWLSLLHFGRFGWFAEAVWTLLGLVPLSLIHI